MLRFSAFLMAVVLYVTPVHADPPPNVKEAIDVIVLFCVAGGEENRVAVDAKAEGGLSLKKPGVTAGGGISISQAEAKGLVKGLRGEMNKITGEQATQARNCMKPYIDRIVDILLGKPSPSPPKGALERNTFRLPENGSPMNNVRVGPFCCTGDIAIVRSTDGNPVGYIYFYDWEGQAYNVEGGSIVPDFAVLVSGPLQLGEPDSKQIENRIAFYADRLSLQSGWIPAGALEYRATVLDYKLERGQDSKPYFKMGSLKVQIDVQIAYRD